MTSLIPSFTTFIAMGPPPQPGDNPIRVFLMNFGPIVLVMIIFYLMLIRPQQKQQKEQRKMLEALKVGDQVVTSSGICGIVHRIKEKEKSFILKSADETKIELLRSSIQQVLPPESKSP